MHKSSPTVVVIEYDSGWPRWFEDLRARIWVIDATIRGDQMKVHVPGPWVPPAADPILVRENKRAIAETTRFAT